MSTTTNIEINGTNIDLQNSIEKCLAQKMAQLDVVLDELASSV